MGLELDEDQGNAPVGTKAVDDNVEDEPNPVANLAPKAGSSKRSAGGGVKGSRKSKGSKRGRKAAAEAMEEEEEAVTAGIKDGDDSADEFEDDIDEEPEVILWQDYKGKVWEGSVRGCVICHILHGRQRAGQHPPSFLLAVLSYSV